MICSNCGKEIAAGSKFCTYCGTPVRNSQDGNPADKGPHPYETEFRPADGADRALTEEHFTPEETQALLATKEWIERDGSLYVSATEGLGGMSGNSLDVWITKDSNTQYTVTVQELLNGEEAPGISDPYSVHYRNVDGRWVFDGVVLTQNRPITLRE